MNNILKTSKRKAFSLVLALTLILTSVFTSFANVTVETNPTSISNKSTITVASNSSPITVDVTSDTEGILSINVLIKYNPNVIKLTNIVDGLADITPSSEANITEMPTTSIDGYAGVTAADGTKTAADIGLVKLGWTNPTNEPLTSTGKLFSLTFNVVGTGSTEIELIPVNESTPLFGDIVGDPINAGTITPGTVNVEVITSDTDSVAAAKSALTLGDLTAVTAPSITLPTSGTSGTAISWQSSNTSVITTGGAITRPTYTQGDATVTLTATISKGVVTDTKVFTATVLKNDPTDTESVALDKAALVLGDLTSVTASSITLPTSGANGTTISWQSSNTSVITTSGAVTRPTFTTGDATVTLTATISKGSITDTKVFTATVIKLAQTDEEAVAAAKAALTIANANNITGNITLPTTGLDGTTISWASSNPSVVTTSGAVTRPSMTEEDVTVDLTATISKGSVNDTKVITVTVKKQDPSDQGSVDAAKASLTLGSLTSVKNNITLPSTGLYGTSITWSSNNTGVISNTGVVNRPAFGTSNANVTLTATITKGTASATTTFGAIVLMKQDGFNSFSLAGITTPAAIDHTAKTITLTSSSYVDVKNAIATFDVPSGTTVTVGAITQVSGTTANDYSNGSVAFGVTDVDGNTSVYNVIVTVGKQFSVNLTKGVKTGNNVTCSAIVTNMDSDDAKTVTLFVALYDSSNQNDMISYQYVPQTINGGASFSTYDIGFGAVPANYVIKAFVWDSISGMRALSNVETK